MLSFIKSFLPTSYFLPGWLILDTNPVDGLLQGLVGACGISVLCSLMRVHFFLVEESWSDESNEGKRRTTPCHERRTKTGLTGMLQFFIVTGILSVVGSRVASLVVLEFCLRSVSGLITSGQEYRTCLQQLMVQSQFSVGCAISCSLYFLHEGASQRWLCLLLAAALSWFLARQASRLMHHVMALYKLHSSQRYCGICISLLSSGQCLLPMLCRTMVLIFTVAVVASVSIINQHFLSAAEAIRFWTPLTICYTLLVVYMQDAQHHAHGSEVVLNTVMVRLGGLMVLMLTVGRWADVLHILMCFLGEASCLIPTMDLLDAASSQVSESPWNTTHKRYKLPLSAKTPKRGQSTAVFIRPGPKMRLSFSNLSPRWTRFKTSKTDSDLMKRIIQREDSGLKRRSIRESHK